MIKKVEPSEFIPEILDADPQKINQCDLLS